MKNGQWGIGQWGALAAVIGTIIAIIVYRAELISFFMGMVTLIFLPTQQPVYETPSVISTTTVEPIRFDFSKISVLSLSPMRMNLYKNSNNLICYSFNNPTVKINSSFTLLGEWFVDEKKVPSSQYKQELPYEEIFINSRVNWYQVQNATKVKFKLGLSFNKTPLFAQLEYNLTDANELSEYLKEKDGNITWNDELVRDLIRETSVCGLSDEQQANTVLEFIRNKMNPPLETSSEIYYNNVEFDSQTSWKDKIGTSSEYSYVYAAFLRSISIPAKIETNTFEDYRYHYVKIFLQDRGWVPVDVFNENKKIGDCFNFNSNLKKGIEYKDICINNLSNYVLFDRIIINRTLIGPIDFTRLDYVLRSSYAKQLKSYCIKVNASFYDENLTHTSSTWWYLLSPEDLEVNGTQANFFYMDDINFTSLKLELLEFSDLCK